MWSSRWRCGSRWPTADDQIEAEFAGGRVDASDLDRIAVLIWGRLDSAAATAAGALVSVPEACRLSDALAGALRARLGLAPAVEESARRLRSLRAQLDRLHDQVALEPPASRPTAQRQLDALVARVADVGVRLERGGDIGGLLGPLENDASRTERDLIVGGVQRRESRDQFAALERLRADLTTREAHVTALADEAVATVLPAPRNAVPDVSLLGARTDRPRCARGIRRTPCPRRSGHGHRRAAVCRGAGFPVGPRRPARGRPGQGRGDRRERPARRRGRRCGWRKTYSTDDPPRSPWSSTSWVPISRGSISPGRPPRRRVLGGPPREV